MRRNIVAIVLAALLIVLAAVGVSAEEEITLAALVGRVEAIEQRIAPNAFVDEDDKCRLAMEDRIHVSSLVSYLEKYPDEVAPNSFVILSVYEVPDIGTEITFEGRRRLGNSIWGDRYVTETWNGCEFVGHSDWWEDE